MTARTIRAVVYCRVSSEEQTENTSLSDQLARCRTYCASRNWEVVGEYVEEGISGAKRTRPELDRLLEQVRTGGTDAVVALKTDRFSRSRAHLFEWLEEFASLRVAFVSVTEAFDTSTAAGDAMVGMLGVFAQMERRLIADRTQSGLRARVQAGGWGGGNIAPYGYRIVGQGREARLEVDPHEQNLIHVAVSLLLDEGLTSGQAAQRLNVMGLTPRNAPLWSSQNLRNMITRGQFDGSWTFAKPAGRVKSHEPITIQVAPVLSPDRVQAVRAYLKATALLRSARHPHPLSGRLICRCSGHMTGIARSDRANRRYRCTFGRNEPGRPFCGEPSLPADRVDDAVWREVVGLLSDPALLERAAQDRVRQLASEPAAHALTADEALRRRERAQRALAGAAARCIGSELDEQTTQQIISNLKKTYDAAADLEREVRARAMREQAAVDQAALAARLAATAGACLTGAGPELRAKVFAQLSVVATVISSGRGRSDPVTLEVVGSVDHTALLKSASTDWHLPCGAGAAG